MQQQLIAHHAQQAFDELLLLKRGGRTIYCGPTGHQSQQLVAYFQSQKDVEALPEGTNPASWMLDVSSQNSSALSCHRTLVNTLSCKARSWKWNPRASLITPLDARSCINGMLVMVPVLESKLLHTPPYNRNDVQDTGMLHSGLSSDPLRR